MEEVLHIDERCGGLFRHCSSRAFLFLTKVEHRVALITLACVSVYGGTAKAAVEIKGLERLLSVAVQAEADLRSEFAAYDLPFNGRNNGYAKVFVSDYKLYSDSDKNFFGYFVNFYSQADMLKIASMPPEVHGLLFVKGDYDLGDMGELANIKYFTATCSGLNVDVEGLCRIIPNVEKLTLARSAVRSGDVDCLLRLNRLSDLELSGFAHESLSAGELIQKLVTGVPQLKTLYMSKVRNVNDKSGERMGADGFCFNLTCNLETNRSNVVEIPDWGNCVSGVVEASSEEVRAVEFRIPPGKGKLQALRLSLRNVIPFGETNLVDDGFVEYSVCIRKRGPRMDSEL